MFHPQGPTFLELARQALSSTRVGYDLLAEKFDHTPFRTPDAILNGFSRYLDEVGPLESALDICCGTGAAMERMIAANLRHVEGIDFSAEMLKVARHNLQRSPGNTEMQLNLGDVMKMEYDEEFDLAVCFGALGHVRRCDEDRFVALVARALRSGGHFVFFTHEMPCVLNPALWLAGAFNLAMHARNLLIRPPFVMYYLTFLWPDVKPLLRRHGLRPSVCSPFRGRMRAIKLVDAIKVA